jgi:hypothetical protein
LHHKNQEAYRFLRTDLPDVPESVITTELFSDSPDEAERLTKFLESRVGAARHQYEQTKASKDKADLADRIAELRLWNSIIGSFSSR